MSVSPKRTPCRPRAAKPSLEALEQRLMPATGLTAQLRDGLLVVEGSQGDDVVRVRQVDGTISVDYTLIDTPDGQAVKRVQSALVARVEVRARGGDDLVHLMAAAPPGQLGSFAAVGVDAGPGHVRLVSDSDAGRYQTWLDAGATLEIAGGGASLPPAPTTPLPGVVTPDPGPVLTADEQGLLDLFDDYRAAHGLGALRENAELDEAAAYQANYMAATGLYAHENADGRDVADRALAAGYRFGWIGEVLHLYDPAIRRTQGIERVYGRDELPRYYMDGWDASPPHREILLEAGVRDVGVSISEAGNGMVYAALLVGR